PVEDDQERWTPFAGLELGGAVVVGAAAAGGERVAFERVDAEVGRGGLAVGAGELHPVDRLRRRGIVEDDLALHRPLLAPGGGERERDRAALERERHGDVLVRPRRRRPSALELREV